jgi:hypothetical protein
MTAARTRKGGQIMKEAKEADYSMKAEVMPFRMRQKKGGAALILRVVVPRAGRRTGRTLGITNRVIPVTKSADNAEVFFPVKILKGKVKDGS